MRHSALGCRQNLSGKFSAAGAAEQQRASAQGVGDQLVSRRLRGPRWVGTAAEPGFTMGNSCCHMLAAVLLLLTWERTRAELDHCGRCVPGTYCWENKTCVACSPHSFSSRPGQGGCSICRRCEGIFRTKRPCSPTSDAECECMTGYRCVGPGCPQCEPVCEPGMGAARDGPCALGTQETPSLDCSFGTFKDQQQGICIPWTECSLDGRAVLVNGTKDHDVVCGPPLAGLSPGAGPQSLVVLLALTSTMVVVLLLFVVLRVSTAKHSRKKLLDVVKQPFMKPVQVAQEEDGCSCRFPEEEEYDVDLQATPGALC